MKIAIGNDHSAVELKNIIAEHLKERGYEVLNLGTDSTESCDYPVYGEKVGRAVAECLVTGDGAFKISLDPQAAPGPILEFYGADRVEYARRHGRITGVDFLTPVGRKGRVLYEEYRPGSVGYRLEADGKPLPLSAEED